VSPDLSPVPPADLVRRSLSLTDFDGILFRTHHVARAPLHFGTSRLYRFDSPDGSYGVLYAGRDAYCAFIESMARSPRRPITTGELKDRALSQLKPVRPLRLVDLTESGALLRIGADARLFSGPHHASRLWSAALHAHGCKADGLLYPSRLDPQRHNIALFKDRSPRIDELSRQSWYAAGAQRQLLAEIIEHYRLDLIENHVVVGRMPPASAGQQGLF
jgi:hypothetical protein